MRPPFGSFTLPLIALLLPLAIVGITPQPTVIPPISLPPLMVTTPPQQTSQTASVASIVVEPVPTPPPTKESIQRATAPTSLTGDTHALIINMTIARFGESELPSMLDLVNRESGENPYAINPTSGSCGLPQALPCSKLLAVIGSLDNVPGQIDWMLSYVANRYRTPSQAIAWHNIHHWY